MNLTRYLLVDCAALMEFIRELAELLGIVQQFSSLGSKKQRVVDPFKEQAVQLGFQLLDLKRNGGLRIVEHLCCFGKAAQLGNAQKGHQIFDFHRSSIEIIDRFDRNNSLY